MVGWAGVNYRPGGSLRAWRDYFPNSDIHGIDIQKDTQIFDEERIYTHLCDSTDRRSVGHLMQSLSGGFFDVIIDDGSHKPGDQLATLANFFPYVNAGGYYIIEDIWENGDLLTTRLSDLRALLGDSLMFITEEKNYLVASLRTVGA
jgi:hypothetical protein